MCAASDLFLMYALVAAAVGAGILFGLELGIRRSTRLYVRHGAMRSYVQGRDDERSGRPWPESFDA